jgi:hypothetical protein
MFCTGFHQVFVPIGISKAKIGTRLCQLDLCQIKMAQIGLA